MDKYLSFDNQINDVTRIARYYLRNIAFVSKYLDSNSVKLLVHNYVINRLNYCSSLYFNLPKYQLEKLQGIMNKAARLIRRMPRYERIAPVLIDLHCLPIKPRIIKICVLTYQEMNTRKPEYINDQLQRFELQCQCSQGNGCKNCSQGDTSMKLPGNVHKDLLYNFRAGATEISVLHSNSC